MLIPTLTAATVTGVIASVGYALSAPGYQGTSSDHFDGSRFRNRDAPMPTLYNGGWSRPSWPAYADAAPQPDPPRKVDGLRVTWVGHATVLVQLGGRNFLTDPVWSERCSPFPFAGPRRVRGPGLRIEQLPPIDAILLSHNHYDHLDVNTLKALAAHSAPRIYTGLGNAAFLRQQGLNDVVELDWDQSARLGDTTITATEVRHFSGRGLFDRNRTLWVGFRVDTPAGTLYFAGDTAWGPHFEATHRRYGPVDLALLPIGAFLPRRVMAQYHTDPQEAVLAHIALHARYSLGIHHATFPLATDPFDAPAREMAVSRQNAGLAEDAFFVLDFGEGRALPIGQNRPE